MKPTHILCHYAEIGLKGKNRRFFEDRLIANIKVMLERRCPDSITHILKLYGRIILQISESNTWSETKISEVLNCVFGLAYFAFAKQIDNNLDKFRETALESLSELEFKTFRISTRRSNKYFPYTSPEINENVGGFIVEKLLKKVNLTAPDATCFIDVLEEFSFVYTCKYAGQGGLPVGVSGKVLALISGGIDSPVAAYYGMKRGTEVLFLHFHSVPYTNRASIEKVREVMEVMNMYQKKIRLILVKLAPIQQEITVNSDPKFRIVLYRRFMFRIAEIIAKREKAKAIITGESLGQVASQTIENLTVVNDVVKLPVLRPLIGFDKQEIINKAVEIGTYTISIKPDQDCCSLFVPKHPVTKSRSRDVQKNELNLRITELVAEAVKSADSELYTL